MPNIPSSEVCQLDVVAVNEQRIITLTSFDNQYKARGFWQEDKPLKEGDTLIITNRTATSISAKRFIDGKMDDSVYHLVFDVT